MARVTGLVHADHDVEKRRQPAAHFGMITHDDMHHFPLIGFAQHRLNRVLFKSREGQHLLVAGSHILTHQSLCFARVLGSVALHCQRVLRLVRKHILALAQFGREVGRTFKSIQLGRVYVSNAFGPSNLVFEGICQIVGLTVPLFRRKPPFSTSPHFHTETRIRLSQPFGRKHLLY